MLPLASDTIAAIATPPGQGAVAILRLSGPKSLDILQAIFQPGPYYDQPGRCFAFKPRTLHHGWLKNPSGATGTLAANPPETNSPKTNSPETARTGQTGQPDEFTSEFIDEVLAVYLPGPHSFSGENSAEVHCHGSPAIARAALEAMLAAGARLALPGEFTRRAFLNGRLDLSQAEAVAEIIAAPTLEGAGLARKKLQGALREKVDELRSGLDFLRAQLCLHLDFPDEDASEAASLPESLAFQETLSRLLADIKSLLDAHERAKLLREGALVVLAGPVNAGKSSLLNALLGRERAIVSPQAGTTRDFIEEAVNLDGLPLRLADTAGLRESSDNAEAEGIRRAWELCAEADLILLLLDSANPAPGPAEEELLKLYAAQDKILLIMNKTDLPGAQNTPPPAFAALPALRVSARQRLGLEELLAAIKKRLLNAERANPNEIAPNLRQAQHFAQALHELEAVQAGYKTALPEEILSIHLEDAAGHLAEITGYSASQDILNQVFADFCLGK